MNYGENKYALKILEYVLSKDVKIDFLTYNEISHLNDVRNLVKYVFLIRDISLIIIIFSFSYFYINKKTDYFMKILKNGFLILFSFTLLLLASTLLFFDSLFIFFHQIFFPQGNWAFEPSSNLIILFPKEFWIKQFLIFIGISFSEFIFFYFFYIQNKNRKKYK